MTYCLPSLSIVKHVPSLFINLIWKVLCNILVGVNGLSLQKHISERESQRYSRQLLIWRSAIDFREIASTNRRASWTFVKSGMAKSTAVRRMM